jgi:hypothetical protein
MAQKGAPDDEQAIKALLDGMIVKQRARHMFEGIDD